MENLIHIINCYGEGVYVVESGDTLSSIAEKFSTTENLIAIENNINSEVNIGDKLYIKMHKTIYTVTPMDTLKSIATKFNVSEDRLLYENKISYVYVGERIVIPN